jgi:sterol desaturase/sphingolipid hydroxylase (fatty acid hydroxylase superfamily)
VDYNFNKGVIDHFAQPEGFVLIGGYLSLSWMFNVMPESYYSFEGGIEWGKVAACLILQDVVQYAMHYGEHVISPTFYKHSHKQHHRFINPKLFDAFHGSIADTTLMILLPFLVTARLVHCNVWSYMVFGSWYSCWLVLLHSEYYHVWDPLFRLLGLGTPGDHHVHHKMFNYNYGHLFMWCDKLMGTHRDVHGIGSKGVSGCNGVFNDHDMTSTAKAVANSSNSSRSSVKKSE